MIRLDEIISKFVRSEGKFGEPSLKSYLQSLKETLEKMEARTMTEARRLEIAKEQLNGVRRQSRRLVERNSLLESDNNQLREQVRVLEETNTNKIEENK